MAVSRKGHGESYFNKGRSLVATVTAMRTEHAASQPASRQVGKQAGRQDIDSPHLNSGQPLTKRRFAVRVVTRSRPFLSRSYHLTFFFHNQPPLSVEARAKNVLLLDTVDPGNWVFKGLCPHCPPMRHTAFAMRALERESLC